MGSSKKQTVGYKYFMGLHFGVCQGPVDALLRIACGDRVAWTGSQATNGAISIDAPDLFGGDEREGGVQGALDVMMGADTQTANAYLTSVQGGVQPGYRGLLSAVFRQGSVGSNNPYIKPWAFTVQRILAGWHGGSAWYPEKAQVALAESTPAVTINVQAGVAGAQAVVGGFKPTDVVVVTKPPGLTYKAWSRWNTDAAPTAYGLAWHNDFWLRDDRGTVKQYWSGPLDPETEDATWRWSSQSAAEAAFSGLAIYLTGSTSYTFTISDQLPIGDDRGGLSLRVAKQDAFGMNPAHIVYQCLTDPEWGMGYSPSIIDDVGFRAAADVFHAEGLGLCLHWTQQQTIDAFVQTVMDHAGAVLRQDPRTGLFTIKPMRADYDAGTLPLFDESNIRSLDSFDRAGSPDAVNEITLRYDDADTGKQGSVTVQNLAAVTAVGGVVARSVSYPGLPTAELAGRVAMRDLRALSTPLARVRMRTNRAGYDVLPGDVIRMAWPKLGIAQLVLRVARVKPGSLTDGEVEIEAVEDVFGLGASAYVAQQPPGWQEPSTQPQPIATRVVAEAPYYELQRELSAADLAALPADAGYLLVGAARPSGAALNFRIATRPAGTGSYEEAGTGDFCATGTLAGALSYTATAATLATVSSPGLIEAGTYALLGPEIVRVDAYDAGTNALTLGRGVLDTVATTHAAGATIFFMGSINASDNVERVSGEAINVRLITVSGSGALTDTSAAVDTLTFAGRAARPYPPGRVRVNGEAYPNTAQSPVVLSWAHRNRLQQNLEGDESGNIGPEAGTTYSARLLDAATSLPVASTSAVGGTSWAVSPTPPAGAYLVELWSVRAGVESLRRHLFPLSLAGAVFDPFFANVLLLTHFDGANGSTVFTDSGPLANTVSRINQTVISTAQSQFGGSSALLDGVDDTLQIAHSTSFQLAADDFTIEAFIRPSNVSGEYAIFSKWQVGTNANECYFFGTRPSGRLFFLISSSGIYQPANDIQSATGVIAANTWSHVAVARQGTTIRGFVNGALVFTLTVGSLSAFASTLAQRIGASADATPGRPFPGHIDELRVTRGVARYTAAFTPPSAPFPDTGENVVGAAGALLTAAASLIPGTATNGNATAEGDPGGLPRFLAAASLQRGAAYNDLPSSVLLLLHMDGTNGSTTFTDSSTFGRTLTAQGNAQISTAQSRFGGASATMSGVSSRILIGTAGSVPSEWHDLYEGTCTIEGWVYVNPSETSGFLSLFSARRSPTEGMSIEATVSAFPTIIVRFNGSQLSIPQGDNRARPLTPAGQAGQWLHWAFVREDFGDLLSARLRLFLNGRSLIYRAVGNDVFDWINIGDIAIGSDYTLAIGDTLGNLSGNYVDEVRVTKSVAHYVAGYEKRFTLGVDPAPDFYPADFIPPTAPFPNP